MEEFQIISHNPRDYEETDSVDWRALRHQYAGMAMTGIINLFGSIDYQEKTVARMSVACADALIEELKKKYICYEQKN